MSNFFITLIFNYIKIKNKNKTSQSTQIQAKLIANSELKLMGVA